MAIRVVDKIDQFSPEQALDILVSYSIAEEGSNNLYIGLIETMLAKRDPASYNMVEVEMILSYFPHMVWASEDQMEPLRDSFYYPILYNIEQNLSTLDHRAFVAMFQGMTLTGPKIFDTDLMNRFLNEFVVRLDSVQPPSISEVFTFLELLVTYLRFNTQLLDQVDCVQVMYLSFEKCLDGAAKELTFSQLAGLYWMCANFNYWDEGPLKTLEGRAMELLRNELEI